MEFLNQIPTWVQILLGIPLGIAIFCMWLAIMGAMGTAACIVFGSMWTGMKDRVKMYKRTINQRENKAKKFNT